MGIASLLSRIRCMPVALMWRSTSRQDLVLADVDVWLKRNEEWAKAQGISASNTTEVIAHLLSHLPEFRNLFFKRVPKARIFRWICPEVSTLFLHTDDIGPGFFILHGFATIVSAKSIGANCSINQQVTIGFSGSGNATIGDNVRVGAGAKILGDILVGDRCNIGANAVVVKNVPPDCTVVGVPGRIVKQKGQRVDLPLV